MLTQSASDLTGKVNTFLPFKSTVSWNKTKKYFHKVFLFLICLCFMEVFVQGQTEPDLTLHYKSGQSIYLHVHALIISMVMYSSHMHTHAQIYSSDASFKIQKTKHQTGHFMQNQLTSQKVQAAILVRGCIYLGSLPPNKDQYQQTSSADCQLLR